MKIIKIISIAVLLFTMTIPQSKAGNEQKTFTDFYKNHKHTEAISLNIPGMFVRFLLDEDESSKELTKGIQHVKLLIFEEQGNSQSLTKELNQYLPSGLYNDIMVIRDGEDKVTFKLREKKGKINEIIMIASDSNSSVILCIEGNMDPKDAKELIKTINVDDLKENASEH